MIPKTISKFGYVVKSAPVQYVSGDTLNDLDIKGNCFALLILRRGTARFQLDGVTFDATAPCFVCFDEHENPKLIKKKGVKCDVLYFEPSFLNVNMTFQLIHSVEYADAANNHNLFLLLPFTDREEYVFPVFDEYEKSVDRILQGIENSLTVQTDWYWSCRSRSYFMELMFILERTYDFTVRKSPQPTQSPVNSARLQKALVYIEAHYHESIGLPEITAASALNHTSLTKIFKEEFNTTPMEYLWQHRLTVAKKQLEFTNLPLKDIADRCGFKTMQHFCRKFKSETGCSPSEFREMRVKKRISDFSV